MIPIGGVPELSSLREELAVLVWVGIPVGVLSKGAVGYSSSSVADEVTKVRGASIEVVGNLLVGTSVSRVTVTRFGLGIVRVVPESVMVLECVARFRGEDVSSLSSSMVVIALDLVRDRKVVSRPNLSTVVLSVADSVAVSALDMSMVENDANKLVSMKTESSSRQPRGLMHGS
jgi:hypothetical protein